MLANTVRVCGLSTIILIAVYLSFRATRPQDEIGWEHPASQGPALTDVDYVPFDALLKKYVDKEGLVAYAAWKASAADIQALRNYLENTLGSADIVKPCSPNARLAFWINAYNALTLWGILEKYPTHSIQDHVSHIGGYNIWKNLRLWVGNQRFSLDNMEHDILRKLNEPRIHFALVCASKGCPPLRNEAYTPDRLDEQLTDNARHFFARPTNFKADLATRTVYLSDLLNWYGGDFGDTAQAQLYRLRPFLPGAMQSTGWIEEPTVTIEYLKYDWSLNDQANGSK
jgi:hypothetical protein